MKDYYELRNVQFQNVCAFLLLLVYGFDNHTGLLRNSNKNVSLVGCVRHEFQRRWHETDCLLIDVKALQFWLYCKSSQFFNDFVLCVHSTNFMLLNDEGSHLQKFASTILWLLDKLPDSYKYASSAGIVLSGPYSAQKPGRLKYFSLPIQSKPFCKITIFLDICIN